MSKTPLWRRWWMADLLIGLICLGAVTVAFVLAPGAERVAMAGWEVPEICAIKRMTGYPCPGCGLTRSWVYLAHGDWRTAWSMNWLGPILFGVAIFQIPLRTVRVVREWRRRSAQVEAPCRS